MSNSDTNRLNAIALAEFRRLAIPQRRVFVAVYQNGERLDVDEVLSKLYHRLPRLDASTRYYRVVCKTDSPKFRRGAYSITPCTWAGRDQAWGNEWEPSVLAQILEISQQEVAR